jgi:hypothetical protein
MIENAYRSSSGLVKISFDSIFLGLKRYIVPLGTTSQSIVFVDKLEDSEKVLLRLLLLVLLPTNLLMLSTLLALLGALVLVEIRFCGPLSFCDSK